MRPRGDSVQEPQQRPLVTFDDSEREANDALRRFLEIVNSWGENANLEELVSAVHACQIFIVSRMLHRLNPDEFSNWYGAESPDPGPPDMTYFEKGQPA